MHKQETCVPLKNMKHLQYNERKADESGEKKWKSG